MFIRKTIIFSFLFVAVVVLFIFFIFEKLPCLTIENQISENKITGAIEKKQAENNASSSTAKINEVRQPSEDAIFKSRVNDELYQYYPLAVGNKWVYKYWEYSFKGYEDDVILVKENSIFTIKVNRIYDEEGKEYVELHRELRIIGLQEVEEAEREKGIQIIRDIPLLDDDGIVFNTTAILEITGNKVRYLKPAYPAYIDTFPMEEGIILEKPDSERWQSVYGEEALVWKRKKINSYYVESKNQILNYCYDTTVYDARGNSGSIDKIIFCQGVGPVKSISELDSHPNFSDYDELIDYDIK